jgi:hypothetical protein
LSLVKFIRHAPRAPAAADLSPPLKKSVAGARDGLCRAVKSVKVSRDRTVVLTIFWRVCCRQEFCRSAFEDRRKSGDGDDEINGQTRSKKTRRVKPF